MLLGIQGHPNNGASRIPNIIPVRPVMSVTISQFSDGPICVTASSLINAIQNSSKTFPPSDSNDFLLSRLVTQTQMDLVDRYTSLGNRSIKVTRHILPAASILIKCNSGDDESPLTEDFFAHGNHCTSSPSNRSRFVSGQSAIEQGFSKRNKTRKKDTMKKYFLALATVAILASSVPLVLPAYAGPAPLRGNGDACQHSNQCQSGCCGVTTSSPNNPTCNAC